MLYRSEVDGLRAIAVLPVILFHAGLFGFSGGYAGVDIFFVISGYLITRIILDELNARTFTIRNFYERRARRILPALFSMLTVTTLIAVVVMPSELFKSYANSGLTVISFISNFHFYSVSDYFSTAAEQKPLLHTWSLAVEEQYYVLFPLLALYAFRKGKSLSAIVIALTLASLLLSQYMAFKGDSAANFYLISSRAWELLFGSIISIYKFDQISYTRPVRQIASLTGLTMVIASFFCFDADTPFPSFYTLLPVIGASLIIIFADRQTLAGKLLSLKPIVAVGLISYSLYLWHQPLFAFLRMKSSGEPSEAQFILAVLLTFVLAFLSYRYVETPFRRSPKFKNKDMIQVAKRWIGIAILGFGFILATDGMQFRFSTEYDATIEHNPKRKQCHTKGKDYLRPEESCHYFNDNVTWATFGDSHTVELAYALAKKLEPHKQGNRHLSFSGCQPALNYNVKRGGCHNWTNETLAYLEQEQSIKNVIVGYRYTGFLSKPDINNWLREPFRKETHEEVWEMYWQSLDEIISRLLKAGKMVYVVYPIPELPDHIATILTPNYLFVDDYTYDKDKTTTVDAYMKRHAFILEKLDSLPFGDNLKAIKPLEAICSEEYCPTVRDGQALYFDDDHLSLTGAGIVLDHAQLKID
jgi:peptidoglycan/LPS O-acetylase OafA/YrhL